MNSSSAMPISEMLANCSGSRDQAEHMRPDQGPADDVAQRRAQPELAEQRDEYQRRRQA